MSNIKQTETTTHDVLFVMVPSYAIDVEFAYIDGLARIEYGVKNIDEEVEP